ncbi:MAG: peptide deformylase [Candidatus Azambacteria bacterium]|nr:peptide deformylase [Candidatus Azambacteria bacterium]
MTKILKIDNKTEEQFLRTKTVDFDFKKWTQKDITELLKKMRMTMKEANGVGLSANQIGLNFRLFVAQVPDEQNRLKFYAIFNPEIIKESREKEIIDEGCLSVPENYAPTPRAFKVVLTGFDRRGKKLKINAWGLLARVFQHETDHLNGKLFIDRIKK